MWLRTGLGLRRHVDRVKKGTRLEQDNVGPFLVPFKTKSPTLFITLLGPHFWPSLNFHPSYSSSSSRPSQLTHPTPRMHRTPVECIR